MALRLAAAVSIWKPAKAEKRSSWPSYPLDAASAWFRRTYADVNTSDVATSLQSVAIRSAVDLIASLASELPGHVYSGDGSERRERPTPGYLEDPGGDGTGLADWAYRVLMSWLLRGNLYGDILETSRPGGFPTQVELFYPDDVSGYIDDKGVVHWTVNGRPVEDPATFLHRRVNPVPGRVLGLSPIAMHAENIGLTITATRFGRQWFTDGAHPSGMLTNDEVDLTGTDVIQSVKDKFLAAVYGTREPLVLGKGWKWNTIQVSPEESQFLATQGFTEAQCARIFGPGIAEILGFSSGDSLTYANVESRSAHLLVYSVNRWLRRLERLLSSMLPRPQYFRIDRDGLLQSTTLDRYKAHELALKNRWKVVNEVRDDEDLTPVEWGSEPNPTTGAPAPSDDEPEKDDTP
jgi:HK97 family phage portal protein